MSGSEVLQLKLFQAVGTVADPKREGRQVAIVITMLADSLGETHAIIDATLEKMNKAPQSEFNVRQVPHIEYVAAMSKGAVGIVVIDGSGTNQAGAILEEVKAAATG